MADINTLLAQILSARYGRDVRQSIHDSIKAINDESTNFDDRSYGPSNIGINNTNYSQYFTDLNSVYDGKAYLIKSNVTDDMVKNMPIQGYDAYFISQRISYTRGGDCLQIFATFQNGIFIRTHLSAWSEWVDVSNKTDSSKITSIEKDITGIKSSIQKVEQKNTEQDASISTLTTSVQKAQSDATTAEQKNAEQDTTITDHTSKLKTLSNYQFTNIRSTNAFWNSISDPINAWQFKPSSIYTIPSSVIKANKVTGLPEHTYVANSVITIITFGGNDSSSPTAADDIYQTETGSTPQAPSAGTVQMVFNDKFTWRRQKQFANEAYPEWVEIINTDNLNPFRTSIEALQNIRFTNIKTDDNFWTDAEYPIYAWAFKPNSIYTIPASKVANVSGLPDGIYALNTNSTILTFGGNNVDSPISADDIFETETGSGYTAPAAGVAQIVLCGSYMWHRQKTSISAVYPEWDGGTRFKTGAHLNDENLTDVLPNSKFSDINKNSIYRVEAGTAVDKISDRPFGTGHNNYTIITLFPLLTNNFGGVQIAIRAGDSPLIDYRVVNADGNYSIWMSTGSLLPMGAIAESDTYVYADLAPNAIYRFDIANANATDKPDFAEFHQTNRHTAIMLSPRPNNNRGAIQILSAVAADPNSLRLVYRAFNSSGEPDSWHGIIDTENLEHFITKSQKIADIVSNAQSLATRISKLEQQIAQLGG